MAAAEVLLALVQSAVAAGAKGVTIESTPYSTVFMHDGDTPSEREIADMLLGGVAVALEPPPNATLESLTSSSASRPAPESPARASGSPNSAAGSPARSRTRRALGVALGVAVAAGCSVDFNVHHGPHIVRVEAHGARTLVDPRLGAGIAAHWSVRVVIRQMPFRFGADTALLRERACFAPIKIILNELPVNAQRFGERTLSWGDYLRGRGIAVALPPPFFRASFPRRRHVIEIRWLLERPDGLMDVGERRLPLHGLGLPLPARACMSLERYWGEETWPRVDDVAVRGTAQRFRRTFGFVQEDGEAWHVAVYRAATVRLADPSLASRLRWVCDGVVMAPETMDHVPGLDILACADGAAVDDSFLRLVRDGAYDEMIGALHERLDAVDRVLEVKFRGRTADDRVATALSGRSGARLLGR